MRARRGRDAAAGQSPPTWLGAVGERRLLAYCARSPARSAAEGHARIAKLPLMSADRRLDTARTPPELATTSARPISTPRRDVHARRRGLPEGDLDAPAAGVSG